MGYCKGDGTWMDSSVSVALQEDVFCQVPAREIFLWKNICRKRLRASMKTAGGGTSSSYYATSFPFFVSLFGEFSSLFTVQENRKRIVFTLTVEEVESWLGSFDRGSI